MTNKKKTDMERKFNRIGETSQQKKKNVSQWRFKEAKIIDTEQSEIKTKIQSGGKILAEKVKFLFKLF